MIAIGRLENKLVILTLSFFLIIIVGIIDFLTSAELTLSIFYLIPVALHALYKGTTKILVIINTVFASFIWAINIHAVNYYSK